MKGSGVRRELGANVPYQMWTMSGLHTEQSVSFCPAVRVHATALSGVQEAVTHRAANSRISLAALLTPLPSTISALSSPSDKLNVYFNKPELLSHTSCWSATPNIFCQGRTWSLSLFLKSFVLENSLKLIMYLLQSAKATWFWDQLGLKCL